MLSWADNELVERMDRPQRHRLLHGYPMLPLMDSIEPGRSIPIQVEESRPLLVGVLPHASCNPRVAGCGFCTFPQERFNREHVFEVVGQVCEEVRRRVDGIPELRHKRIDGLYFGGGTANLTPAPAFSKLCDVIGDSFDLSRAEVTLEGCRSISWSTTSA